MDFIDAIAVFSTVIGSVGWMVALFRFTSENKRDQADATLSLQQANSLLLEQYRLMLEQKDKELAYMRGEVSRLTGLLNFKDEGEDGNKTTS